MGNAFLEMKVGEVMVVEYVPHRTVGHHARNVPGETPEDVDYAANHVGTHANYSHVVARRVKK